MRPDWNAVRSDTPVGLASSANCGHHEISHRIRWNWVHTGFARVLGLRFSCADTAIGAVVHRTKPSARSFEAVHFNVHLRFSFGARGVLGEVYLKPYVSIITRCPNRVCVYVPMTIGDRRAHIHPVRCISRQRKGKAACQNHHSNNSIHCIPPTKLSLSFTQTEVNKSLKADGLGAPPNTHTQLVQVTGRKAEQNG